MNHLAFKIGDMFQIRTKGKNGKPDEVRICRKSSHIGFIFLDESIFGEVQFDSELDAKVEPIPAAAPPAPASAPASPTAPPAAAGAKKPAKKAAKMSVKKAKKK